MRTTVSAINALCAFQIFLVLMGFVLARGLVFAFWDDSAYLHKVVPPVTLFAQNYGWAFLGVPLGWAAWVAFRDPLSRWARVDPYFGVVSTAFLFVFFIGSGIACIVRVFQPCLLLVD